MGACGAKALVPEAARGADELCWEACGMLKGSLCCALNGALGCVPAESCGARGIGMFGGWNTLGA